MKNEWSSMTLTNNARKNNTRKQALKIVSLIYFIVSEINILTKFS